MGLSARVVSCQAAQSPHQAGQISDLTNLLLTLSRSPLLLKLHSAISLDNAAWLCTREIYV